MKAISSIDIAISEKSSSWDEKTQRVNQHNALFKTLSTLNPVTHLSLARRTFFNPSCPFQFMSVAAQKAKEARKRSKAIDSQILQDGKRRRRCAQVVFFAGGHDQNHHEGKRLLLDSMARWSIPKPDRGLLHASKHPETQVQLVRRTVLSVMHEILMSVSDHFFDIHGLDPPHNGELENSQNPAVIQTVRNLIEMMNDKEACYQNVARAIEELWASEEWQTECYEHVGRPRAYDDKVLDILHRAAEPDYTPSSSDIRFIPYCLRTFNGDTYEFNSENAKFVEAVDLNNVFRRLPMSGNKRKTALGYFSDASCLLSPVDLASYTQKCSDDLNNKNNNLALTIQSIGAVAKNKAFPDACTVLILWNYKSFKRKLKTWPLENYFPEYKPSKTEKPGRSAVRFIMQLAAEQIGPTHKDVLKQVFCFVGEPDERRTFDFIAWALREQRCTKMMIDAGIRSREE